MEDWLKGIILLLIGNVLYDFIYFWDPGILGLSAGIIGLIMIFCGLYLFAKDLHRKS